MILSGADLQVGEILRQVLVRLAVRHLHHDRRTLIDVRAVAKLAIVVVSPGVSVPVATYSQGKTIVEVF